MGTPLCVLVGIGCYLLGMITTLIFIVFERRD